MCILKSNISKCTVELNKEMQLFTMLCMPHTSVVTKNLTSFVWCLAAPSVSQEITADNLKDPDQNIFVSYVPDP